ncbi:FG-GAP repeat domain-containing protein [Cecembia rubra]|uniref:FG-GAP repeat domain-containing protein n=1 Tax=Cecembia rubra TaxID=1485585 RepID=UPI0027145D29|nr:VCBS repeat-containing protein [Cecembia rubra]
MRFSFFNLLWVGVLFLVIACQSSSKNDLDDFDKIRSINNHSLELSGKSLSDAYCSACHLKPDPSLLDKATWERSVLPDMRRRLGLITADDFGVAIGEDNGAPLGIYSTETLIRQVEWDLIQAYYLENAPEKLGEIVRSSGELQDLEGFELVLPNFTNKRPSLTTIAVYHEEESLIYLGDRLNQIFRIDPVDLSIIDSIAISSPVSDIRFREGGGLDLLHMGYMDPSNLSIGQLKFWETGQFSSMVIADSLRRPVNFSFADLNGDGKEDVVISNFGHHIGNLLWFEQTLSGFEPRLLNERPGARKTIVDDVNGDGLPDVIVLMTQAKEGVFVYFNLGNGEFREENWLAFDPVFGSSDFDWVDIDGDGYKEIVLVNGDNADFSPILKPYHGLRIFKNDGSNQFEEVFFYPMHGASGLVVGEFTADGKTDIAVISHFPSKNQDGLDNFLFFEQKSAFEFEVKTKPELGQWSLLTISKGDISGNGKEDIILGSFDFKTIHAYPAVNWMPFIILSNQIF